MRSKDFRRHQIQRIKKYILDKILKARTFHQFFTLSLSEQEYLEKELRRMVHTRKRCSCDICGNKRKFHGKTHKEIKHDLQFEDELCDFYSSRSHP
jgi:hypothetical protein